MVKRGLKTADQTYLRTVWAWLMGSLTDGYLSNTPNPLRPSYRTNIIIQPLCDAKWMKKVMDQQTFRRTDEATLV